MVTNLHVKLTGVNNTTRRFPRSMFEAFPDERAVWHTLPTRPSLLQRFVRWISKCADHFVGYRHVGGRDAKFPNTTKE